MVLSHLLRGLSPEQYCLLSHVTYHIPGDVENASATLPARRHDIRPRVRLGQLSGLVPRGAGPATETMLHFLQCAVGIARTARRERATGILACSGDPFNLPSAYLASRLLRLPLYAYIFDDYQGQWHDNPHRTFATRTEPWFIRGAEKVIVPNEFLAETYRQRYNAECAVIRNASEAADNLPTEEAPWPEREGEIAVTYTGAVYHAHYDAFRNLIEAIVASERPGLKLHLYTAWPMSTLERQNIRGPIVRHPHLPDDEITAVQRHADILFLPLGFDTPYLPELIRTSSPGKMGEYLASGRPVLVHAPADSFIASYFKKHRCGLVVDQNDPQALEDAIDHLIESAPLRRRLVNNALERAQADFSLANARATFTKVVRL
jgi:glycosyltransferase involved in cell wall biosynthesis